MGVFDQELSEEVKSLRSLTGTQLEEYLRKNKWYVREDDLIGGSCIMPVDENPSQGCFSIGNFLSRELSEHIVDLHNISLNKEHEHKWKQTAGLTVGDVYTCEDCGTEELRHSTLK